MERPDLYVLARFLDVLYENRRLKKTNLQNKVGLNYPRFMEYLDWMIKHSFVQREEEDGSEVYILSQQGYDAHKRLVSWIRDAMKGMRI